MKENSFDTIVVGSGLAGLTAAYYASQTSKVAIITKSELDISSSYYAQGGIAAVISADDDQELHVHDTLVAGRGLCERDAVNILVSEGAGCIKEIIKLGMQFDKDENNEMLLGLEGGHSKRRILHADGDATGKHLTKFMLDLVLKQKNIVAFENATVINIITNNNSYCGLRAFCFKTNKDIYINSSSCVLATGGLSRVYSRTTNPNTATGDGVSLAYEAGAEIEDLEFVQFHPSALSIDGHDAFLISEAVRGEGAWLLNDKGERFMESIHPLAELAPRDIVAFSIYQQMIKQKSKNVFLSLKHLDPDKIKIRFSNIYKKLKTLGYDMTSDLLPISPAAHYMVGGVKTDLNGATNINGLFACGELASTGVMGANRLASNSLLECIVFGKRAGINASKNKNTCNENKINLGNFENNINNEDFFLKIKNQLADIMSENVGIVRTEKKLKQALIEIKNIEKTINSDYYSEYNKLKAWQLVKVCELITKGALLRKESRGGHIRSDFRNENPDWRLHIVFKKDSEEQYIPVRK